MKKSDAGPDQVRPGAARVLLVDDEPWVLSALRRSLKRAHWKVMTAPSATKALTLLRDQEVDVIVTDERMPGIRGSDLLKVIRSSHPETARILLTGYPGRSLIRNRVRAGIHRLLTKPWSAKGLIATIEELLRELRDQPQGREPGRSRLEEEFQERIVSMDCAGRTPRAVMQAGLAGLERATDEEHGVVFHLKGLSKLRGEVEACLVRLAWAVRARGIRASVVEHGGLARAVYARMPDVPTPELPPRVAPGEGRKVLVVHDDRACGEFLADLLASAGHSVRVSDRAVDGVARIGSDSPDVVLVDLALPLGSALELAARCVSPPVAVLMAPRSARSGIGMEGPPILEVPFRMADVLKAVEGAGSGASSTRLPGA